MLTIKVNFDHTPDLARKVRRKAGKVIAKVTEDATADYKGRITDNTGKSGAVYTLRNGAEHQASAPGESPANQYGDLAANITFEVDEDNLVGTIQAFKNYAPVLELGGENVEARPALRPALEVIEKVLPDALEAAVKSAVNE